MAASNSTDGILQLADTSGASGASVPNTQKAINDANTAITTNTTNIAANTSAIALKAPIASPTFTGTVTAPTFVGALTGNASGSAASFTGSLAGDVTGTQSATAIAAATVTGKALTGYVSGAGTVSATDTILQAIQKINGNDALKAPIASPTFTGNVTAPIIIQPETTTPATPSAGFRKLYPKSDGYYQLDSTGAETKVGSGSGGGGINYITNPDAETSLSGWDSTNSVSMVAGVYPPGGVAFLGHSANSTWTRSTSAPLRGTASFLHTKSAASALGDLALFNCSIDPADRARILAFSFDYSIASGTYADGDLAVVALDATNSKWIIPLDNFKILNVGTGLSATMTGTIQVPYNCANITFGILTLSSSALAYTVKFDNFSFAPQVLNRGVPMTDPVAYTPVFTGFGTVATPSFTWYRDGKYLRCIGSFTTGTVAASLASVSLPSGLTIDSSVSNAGGAYEVVGISARNAVSALPGTVLAASGGTAVYCSFYDSGSANPLVPQNGNTAFASTELVSVKFDVPIQGWSTNTVMSTDAGPGLVVARAYRSSAQTGINPNNSYVKINIDTVSFDTTGSYDTANYKYVVGTAGYYDLQAQFSSASTNVLNNQYVLALYKNGSLFQVGQAIDSFATTALYLTVSAKDRAVVGDYYEVYLYGAGNNSGSTLTSGTGATGNVFSISKVQSPQGIAATERICATYGMTTPQSVSATSVIKFDTKVEDTHGLFSTGTGLFTSNFSGKLRISTVLTASIATLAYIVKNGTGAGYVGSPTGSGMAGSSVELIVSPGDTFGIYMNSAATAYGTATQGYQNQVTFERVT